MTTNDSGTSRDAAIAQYDQNLADCTETIKRIGPVALVVFRKLVKVYEETRDTPGEAYDHFVADMALLGLSTCIMAIDREMDDE